jgi:RNA polymerase sigma-70 factor (ECF subfamily)
VNDTADDDAALVRRVQVQADRQAFAQLVRRHQGRVRALLRRLTRGRSELADELAQEAFLQAWRALPAFRGEAGFATWLYRLAVNEYLQGQRRGDARLQACTDALDADREAADCALAAGDAPEEGLALDLRRALARLPEAEHQAIALCDLAGLSHGEAADWLGCPLGTVKSHVARGRARLREALAAWAPAAPMEVPT